MSTEFQLLKSDIEAIRSDIKDIKKDIQKLYEEYGKIVATLDLMRNGVKKLEMNVNQLDNCVDNIEEKMFTSSESSKIQLRNFLFDVFKMFIAALLALVGIKLV